VAADTKAFILKGVQIIHRLNPIGWLSPEPVWILKRRKSSRGLAWNRTPTDKVVSGRVTPSKHFKYFRCFSRPILLHVDLALLYWSNFPPNLFPLYPKKLQVPSAHSTTHHSTNGLLLVEECFQSLLTFRSSSKTSS
jgi:hypothetical protein